VEYVLTAVGTIDAYERVQITARVAGVVDHVRFGEGQAVKAGQVLVDIEPARYRLAAASARASMTRAEATQEEADAVRLRREAVAARDPGLMTAEELAGVRAKARIAAADVDAARAALSRAQLDLRDALLKAPRAGVIETKSVQTGQYVQPGTVLATLVQRDPLRLRFGVSEPDAARLLPGMPVRFRVRSGDRDLQGKVVHVAQLADEASRMVPVLADVDATTEAGLRPGAFAEVTVPIGGAADAAVIPQTAVRPSERGFLAFVVEGGVARERILRLGLRTAEGLVEVRSGLRPGETLVVRGAEALRDGATVQVAGPAATR